jgi:anaerobic magnesium-protoporphyrin IX monomethyl ester cyclase
MKILVFNPPTPDGRKFIREGRCTQEEEAWGTLWPPISLASVAAVLEHDGHKVVLRDFPAEGLGWDALETSLTDHQPKLVLWSTATPTLITDLALAAQVKTVVPTAKTAVLGTHVGSLYTDCLNQYPALDFILRGEPERPASDLARALDAHSPLQEVAGLALRGSGTQVVCNIDAILPKSLDDFPDPAWHLLKVENYRIPLRGKPFLMVLPTRGCPYPCSFCTAQSFYGSSLRKKSIPRVVAEIKRDIDQFGVRDFLFLSDTFTLDRVYVRELCQAFIANNLDISWASNSRVDTIEPDTFRWMKKAGCWMVSFGIESGVQEVLDAVGKHIKVEQVEQAVRWAREAGLQTTGHFVLGMPGDTPETIQHTITFSQRVGLDFAQYYCSVPFPGSRLYEEALTKGWLPKGIPWENFRQDKAILEFPGLSSSQVEQFRDQAYREFYNQPRRWWQAAKLLRPAGIPNLLQAAKLFLKWSTEH